jgi:hypothetical protein
MQQTAYRMWLERWPLSSHLTSGWQLCCQWDENADSCDAFPIHDSDALHLLNYIQSRGNVPDEADQLKPPKEDL